MSARHLAYRLLAHAATLHLRCWRARRTGRDVRLSVGMTEKLTRDLARAAHYIERNPS